jgi:hypothetical protein
VPRPAGRNPLPPVPSAPPFVLTFWCGPPLGLIDDARVEQIAAAGFNVIGAPCEGLFRSEANRHALDVARRHGLRMWVRDPRFSERLGAARRPDRVAAAVADYREDPAVAGYFVWDEPGVSEFADVASITAVLRAADPQRLAYVNLFPDYVSPNTLQASDYEEYLDEFVRRVRPRLLSFDYYPFLRDDDRPSFFRNLATMRDVSLRDGIPFLLIIQAMPHGPYRDPSEDELRWQAFHGLAYGARGISYFAYWTPRHGRHTTHMHFRSGLIDHGEPTRKYFQALRLNRELLAVGGELATYRSIGVADSRGRIAARPPIGPIAAVEGGVVTVGFFAKPGAQAVLLVNRNYWRGAGVEPRLLPGAGNPEILDAASGRWSPWSGAPIALPPGGAALLRWQKESKVCSRLRSTASMTFRDDGRCAASGRTHEQ